MPLLDYECQSCGKLEEKLVSRPPPEEVQCTFCNNMMKKKLSALGDYAIRGNNSASTRPRKVK